MLSNIDHNIDLLQSGKLFTEVEAKLFTSIRTIISSFSSPLIVRVAGGWVRDKLLGKNNDDIDLVIDGTDCLSFAEQLKPFYEKSSKVTFIPAKPEQKKFLDIARISLFKNFYLDIVNMRPDPTASPDLTPIAIDALRRDFTINALFFNINDYKVEDFVNGIDDLKNGIIKTPISVEINFQDDPIRILRAFRFAARFGFSLEPNIFSIPSHILKSFSTDVSRDRFELELSKILIGPSVPQVLEWCVQSGIWSTLFDYKNQFNLQLDIPRVKNAFDRFENYLIKDSDSNSLLLQLNGTELFPLLGKDENITKTSKKAVILASIFYPLAENQIIQDPTLPNRKIPLIKSAVSRNLEMSLDLGEFVSKLIKATKELVEMKKEELDRVKTGQWLREIGREWILTRCLLSEELLLFFDQTFVSYVLSNELEGVWKMTPLLNGKELAQLHGIKPGPQLGILIKELIKWQLANPKATADDYKATVKK